MRVEITAREAAQKVLAAYEAGTLVAQTPQPICGRYYEQQEGQVYRCAIGQLFTVEEARNLEYDQPVYPMASALIEDGMLVVDAPLAFILMQSRHDTWADTRDEGTEDYFIGYVRELAHAR